MGNSAIKIRDELKKVFEKQGIECVPIKTATSNEEAEDFRDELIIKIDEEENVAKLKN